MSSTTTATTTAIKSMELLVASSKEEISSVLCNTIVTIAYNALYVSKQEKFTIALSGGSLPKFLSSLSKTFKERKIDDPQWKKWYIFLADERCVPITDDDSNLKSIYDNFLDNNNDDGDVSIPKEQIYGIDEGLVDELVEVGKVVQQQQEEGDNVDVKAAADAIAVRYEEEMKKVLDTPTGLEQLLDLAVLGFGPDGHTCSLFPGRQHDQLLEKKKEDEDQNQNQRRRWVFSIIDSPKQPPVRVTLSLSFLNEKTRHVIVCGAGTSKYPIMKDVFDIQKLELELEDDNDYKKKTSSLQQQFQSYHPTMATPPPYPCSMVVPKESLTWIVDYDAMIGNKKEE